MTKRIYKIHLVIFLQIVCCLPSNRITAQTPSPSEQGIKVEDFILQPLGLNFPDWEKKREGLLRFSIENNQRKNFNQLKGSDIKVTLDGNPVVLSDGNLTLTENKPSSVYILLDGSLSMLGDAAKIGKFRNDCLNPDEISEFDLVEDDQDLDKLKAAKSALISFISKLKKEDSVGIYAFDSSLYEVVAKTTDKEKVKNVLGDFKPRCGDYSNRTELYGSVEDLLKQSGKDQIQNIIVVSDGMQDTVESGDFLLSGFDEYKSGREADIIQNISKSGTRIFSVPIGDENSLPKDPNNLSYVDKETLCNIGNEATGGACKYVDLPMLKAESEKRNISYQTLLEDTLKDTLQKIKDSFKFGYELRVPIEAKNLRSDIDTHELEFHFPVAIPNQKKELKAIDLQYNVSFLLGRNSVPVPKDKGRVIKSELITFSETTQPSALFAIYFSIVGFLSVVGIIPVIFGFIRTKKRKKEELNLVNSVIVEIDENSPYLGTFCMNKDEIKLGEAIIICPNCKKVHHLGCWELNNFRCHDKHNCPDQLMIPQHLLDKYEG